VSVQPETRVRVWADGSEGTVLGSDQHGLVLLKLDVVSTTTTRWVHRDDIEVLD